MVSRAEEQSRDPFLSKPLEERLVVRDDDRAIRSRKGQQSVIGGTPRIDHTKTARQPQAGAGPSVPPGPKIPVRQGGVRGGDIGVPPPTLGLPIAGFAG